MKTVTSEILQLAKAQLTPANWGQSDETVMHGEKRCVLTAIGIAEERADRWFTDAEDVLKQVCLGDPEGFLSTWNDAPERTFQDVLDAFDAAIAIAQQQERLADDLFNFAVATARTQFGGDQP